MEYRRSLGSLVVLLMLIASPALAKGNAFTFKAEVDKTKMAFEDVLNLSFVISGDNIVTELKPDLPDVEDDFDILRGPNRSSSISIINGNYTSSTSYQYILSPKKTGTFEIGAATVKFDGKTYKTEPIKIEVVKDAVQQPSSSASQPDNSPQQVSPEVFIQAEIDKETAFIGEQITISYWIYTQVNIAGYDIRQKPNFKGFWVEELKIPTPPKLQYKTINGQRYGIALIGKAALFPTSSGKMTIDPMLMTFSVKVRGGSRFSPQDPFDNFFGRTQEIIRKTQPIGLNVFPLPEDDRPASFNGDVGNFTMSVDLDQTEVKQDDPITLTVKIQGTGNIKTVKEPEINLPESFKRYDAEITENPYSMQEPIQGEKIFKRVIIPSDEGQYQIDPVKFSYFDPQRKSYQTLSSEPLNLIVKPNLQTEEPMERRITTKEEIKLLGKDIRFIRTGVSHLENQGHYLYQSRWFQMLHLLPILAIFIVWAGKRYRDKYMSDEQYVRQRRANKLSKQRLKASYELMESGNSKEFYATISSTLRQYLGDKLSLPPAGITGSEISQLLRERGLDEDTAQLLKHCLDECDYARFAPVEGGKEEMKTILQHTETIIDQIERLKGLKSTTTIRGTEQVMIFLIVSVLSLWGWSVAAWADASVEDLFKQANAQYDAGKYDEAITQYQQILDSGIENGYVYYNQGNALLKTQRIGEAILSYERAKRLLPRDEDVAFNLEYAQALTLDKMGQDHKSFFSKILAIREMFTPNEVSLTFLGLYALLTFLIIVFIFGNDRWKRLIIFGALLPAIALVISGILLLSVISYSEATDEAILLAQKVDAKTGPGDAYSTVFEIHEGANVRIQREKLDWVEIKLPNNVIGWVQKKDLERIHP